MAMPTFLPNFIKKIRTRDLLGRFLMYGFAGLALAVPAQSQAPDQNPDSNSPVAIPPAGPVQPQPAKDVQVQPPPPGSTWDRWGIEKIPEDDNWTRHFRLGAMVGLGIKANFNTTGSLNVNRPAGVFDDGYVRKDNTGNAGGQTSFWGYDTPGQYNSAAQTLTMHNTTSFNTSAGSDSSSSSFVGIDMAYGGNLFAWGSARVGWDLGFGWLPINLADKSTKNVTSINRSTLVFDARNPFGTIPGAPYQGGPQGGPTINPTPTPASGNQILTPGPLDDPWTVTGSSTLDVSLYTVRLGPSVYWDIGEYFGFSAGVGPAVGIVNGNYNFDETVTASSVGVNVHNKGQINGTDFVYGGYVNASLMYHLVRNGDLYVGVQYMSLGNANISGGGRSAQLDLGGQIYISAGLNWPF